MPQQSRELLIALMIVLVASLSYVACQRGSESSSEELKPRASALQIGEMAPNFTLEDHHNQKVTWPQLVTARPLFSCSTEGIGERIVLGRWPSCVRSGKREGTCAGMH